jgi:hypothetical protein
MKYKDDIDPLVIESGIPRSKTFITWRWHSIDELLLGVMRSREWFNAVFEKTKFVQRLGGFFRAGEHHEADFVSLRWSQSNLHYARTARLWMSTILSHEKGLQFLANNRRGKIGSQIAAKLREELSRLETAHESPGWKSRRKRSVRGGGGAGAGGAEGGDPDSSDGEGGWRRPPVLLPGLGSGSPTRSRSGSGFLDRATSSGNRARGASLDEARRTGSVVGMLASNMIRGRRPSGNSLSAMVAASADRAWVTQTASPLSRGSIATTLAREWLPLASMLLATTQVRAHAVLFSPVWTQCARSRLPFAPAPPSFMYRYIPRESCTQFDLLPLTSLMLLATGQVASQSAEKQCLVDVLVKVAAHEELDYLTKVVMAHLDLRGESSRALFLSWLGAARPDGTKEISLSLRVFAIGMLRAAMRSIPTHPLTSYVHHPSPPRLRVVACIASPVCHSPPSRSPPPARSLLSSLPPRLHPSKPRCSHTRYTGRGEELGGESAHNTVGCLPHFDRWGVDLLVGIIGDATYDATVDATVGGHVHKGYFELAEVRCSFFCLLFRLHFLPLLIFFFFSLLLQLATLALYEAVTGDLWRSANADLYVDPRSAESGSGSSAAAPGETTNGHVLNALVRALAELDRQGKRTGSIDLADLSLARLDGAPCRAYHARRHSLLTLDAQGSRVARALLMRVASVENGFVYLTALGWFSSPKPSRAEEAYLHRRNESSASAAVHPPHAPPGSAATSGAASGAASYDDASDDGSDSGGELEDSDEEAKRGADPAAVARAARRRLTKSAPATLYMSVISDDVAAWTQGRFMRIGGWLEHGNLDYARSIESAMSQRLSNHAAFCGAVAGKKGHRRFREATKSKAAGALDLGGWPQPIPIWAPDVLQGVASTSWIPTAAAQRGAAGSGSKSAVSLHRGGPDVMSLLRAPWRVLVRVRHSDGSVTALHCDAAVDLRNWLPDGDTVGAQKSEGGVGSSNGGGIRIRAAILGRDGRPAPIKISSAACIEATVLIGTHPVDMFGNVGGAIGPNGEPAAEQSLGEVAREALGEVLGSGFGDVSAQAQAPMPAASHGCTDESGFWACDPEWGSKLEWSRCKADVWQRKARGRGARSGVSFNVATKRARFGFRTARVDPHCDVAKGGSSGRALERGDREAMNATPSPPLPPRTRGLSAPSAPTAEKVGLSVDTDSPGRPVIDFAAIKVVHDDGMSDSDSDTEDSGFGDDGGARVRRQRSGRVGGSDHLISRLTGGQFGRGVHRQKIRALFSSRDVLGTKGRGGARARNDGAAGDEDSPRGTRVPRRTDSSRGSFDVPDPFESRPVKAYLSAVEYEVALLPRHPPRVQLQVGVLCCAAHCTAHCMLCCIRSCISARAPGSPAHAPSPYALSRLSPSALTPAALARRTCTNAERVRRAARKWSGEQIVR